MNETLAQLQNTDYTNYIAGSYAVAGIILLWVLWRSLAKFRTEKRLLERVKLS